MIETRIVPLVESLYGYGLSYPQWQYRSRDAVNKDIQADERDGFEVVLKQPNTNIIVLQKSTRVIKE